MEPLWFRLMDFARAEGLSYGLGVSELPPGITAFVGDAQGSGPTSNEAINDCADKLVAAHGWVDDRDA